MDCFLIKSNFLIIQVLSSGLPCAKKIEQKFSKEFFFRFQNFFWIQNFFFDFKKFVSNFKNFFRLFTKFSERGNPTFGHLFTQINQIHIRTRFRLCWKNSSITSTLSKSLKFRSDKTFNTFFYGLFYGFYVFLTRTG